MQTKKQEDEANLVEGRETFDYSVPHKRKKQLVSEHTIENSPPKLLKNDTIDADLLEWIKERVENSINMFDTVKHWTSALEEEVKRLCLLEEGGLRLFVWVEGETVKYTTDVPHEIGIDTAVIFKISQEPVTQLEV